MSRQRVPNKMLQDLVDVSALHTTGATTLYPSGGAGLELYSYPQGAPTSGNIQSYDRGASAWLDLVLNFRNLTLTPQVANSKLFVGSYNPPPFMYPLGSGSLSIESPNQYLMLHSKASTHLAGNAYWDGANWYKYDTSQASCLFIIGPTAFTFYTSAAGTGAIGWTSAAVLSQSTGLMTGDTWHTVTYQNGFTAWSGWNDCQYTRTPAGEVRFRGLLGSPASGWGHSIPAFTLPVGYRLAYEPGSGTPNYHHFMAMSDSSTNVGGITIATTGVFSPWIASGGASSGVHYWDIGNISYMAV